MIHPGEYYAILRVNSRWTYYLNKDGGFESGFDEDNLYHTKSDAEAFIENAKTDDIEYIRLAGIRADENRAAGKKEYLVKRWYKESVESSTNVYKLIRVVVDEV